MFVTQHMPPLFTSFLAERLSRCGPVRVHEGKEGMTCCPATPISRRRLSHDREARGHDGEVHLNEEPPENSCRPAVDVMFRSLANVYGGHVLGAVLTGIGADGTMARPCSARRAPS